VNPFLEKLATLWPEMVMLTGAVACLATGLWSTAAVRKATPWVAAATMVIAWVWTVLLANGEAGAAAAAAHPLGIGAMVPYVKCLILALGLILLAVNLGVPERLKQSLRSESPPVGPDSDAGPRKGFDPGSSVRGEFYAFFLLSITGVMLTAGATDLVWLFLALELTSLPTYVMIATSRDRPMAQESAIKYFFLGALSAAVFLYGFALIYGATGFTEFGQIAVAAAEIKAAGGGDWAAAPSGLLLVLGLILSVLGLCYKVAAVPMHLYAADVYEGAATPVTAFLAVVPKTAGFAALILVLGLVGWDLPPALATLLVAVSVLTMTIGNVLAIIQTNLKRTLAYSSIAHSGYLLTGLVAGVAVKADLAGGPGSALGNGVAAVLFYLLAYGMGTIGSFAVLACVRRRGGAEVDEETGEPASVTYDDLAGLWWRSPALAGIMLVAMLSLVGMPPLAGFLGKVYLIGGVFSAGYAVLAVCIVVNSAISAGYYLRIAMACFFGEPDDQVGYAKPPWLVAGAVVTTLAAFALGGYAAHNIVQRSHEAVTPTRSLAAPVETASQPAERTALSDAALPRNAAQPRR
jgi:NADH-quinone oxidoreductase subunit N